MSDPRATCECDPMGEGIRPNDHNLWCPRYREQRLCDRCQRFRFSSRHGSGWMCDHCKGQQK